MSSYNETDPVPKDLDLSTPTEGATPPAEVNNAIREVKRVMKVESAIVKTTGNLTLTEQHSTVLINGAHTVTLPAVADVSSSTFTKRYRIINISASTGVLKTDTGSETLNGSDYSSTGLDLPNRYKEYVIYGNGTVWYMETNVVFADTISEITSGSGVTADGLKMKDGDVILENLDTISGKEVGGSIRDLIKINSSDDIVVGDTNNLLRIRSSGIPTWNFGSGAVDIVDISKAQTLTNKTLTTPTIASFTNATHDHADAAGGGNTLTTPTIASFTNATHDHADDAGGGTLTVGPALTVRPSGQNVGASTATKILFGSAQVDTNTNYDGANDRFLPTVEGYYRVSCNIALTNTAAEAFYLRLYKDGGDTGQVASVSGAAGVTRNVIFDSIVLLNGSEYIEMFIDSTADTDYNISSGFSGHWAVNHIGIA